MGARERQHNQANNIKLTNTSSENSGNPHLAITAGSDLDSVPEKIVKFYFKWTVLSFISKTVFNIFLIHKKTLFYK